MSEIHTGPSATALWQELVREGEQRAGRALGEELESYLVFTLMRHLGDARLARRVMALDLLEALHLEGARREQDLRDVGDRCLLLAGLYPEQARRRLVPLSYFVALGQSAYQHLAEALRIALATLYRQLADGFAELVRVLVEVRRLSGEWRGLDRFAAYELCTASPTGRTDATAREFPGVVLLDPAPREH